MTAGPDVFFLSSLFDIVKIAEPMGASLLAAGLRQQGFTVELLEPSVEGLGVEQAVKAAAESPAPVVALSMLRDKHVGQVLRFVTLLRAAAPRKFVVIGGHGPSIAVAGIPVGASPEAPGEGPVLRDGDEADLARGRTLLPLASGALVDGAVTMRGGGPAEPGYVPLHDSPHSTYYDVSREYLQILASADAYLLGEADDTLPELVRRVLDGAEWRDVPGLAYLDDARGLRRNPLPAKIPDIDRVPFMSRDVLVQYQQVYGPKVPASILASRGCFYRCTFCSVVQYERLQSGSIHRQRSNENLVAEIDHLHQTLGISSFNFEDDNFVVKNRAGTEKLFDLCDRILALPYPIEFTFFCRADVVEHELFARLKEAGLVGIYFGLESVYEEDLEFFHKGLSVETMFRALDTLIDIGFSPTVDAERRIMLGYITWHPLTSFDSLRATLDFVRRYDAPPKLLRRKLRIYSGTEVLRDAIRLGVLDPDHPDGWRFLDPRIQGLDDDINVVARAINAVRDPVRTLEKAARQGHPVDAGVLRGHRTALDALLRDTFGELVEVAAAEAVGAASPAVAACRERALRTLADYVSDTGLRELVDEGYRACGFNTNANDLFRK